jgi:hypothetical protein
VNRAQRTPLFWGLIAVLAAEFVLAVCLVIVLLVELLIDTPASTPSAIALTVVTAVAPVWLGAVIVGALRGRAWIRGAALVWQVLQLGVGIAALQGDTGQPAIGWPLIAVAAVGILLLLNRRVVLATSRREGDPD